MNNKSTLLLLLAVSVSLFSCTDIENEPNPAPIATVYGPADFDYDLNYEYTVTETYLNDSVVSYPIVFTSDTTAFLDITLLIEPQIIQLVTDFSSVGAEMCEPLTSQCLDFVYTDGQLVATTDNGGTVVID
jgi:hypothetical protein